MQGSCCNYGHTEGYIIISKMLIAVHVSFALLAGNYIHKVLPVDFT